MDAEALRAVQGPIKDRYREDPAAAMITLRAAGTLDDPEIAKPASTIWASAAPSWACINDTLPKVERQPPPAG